MHPRSKTSNSDSLVHFDLFRNEKRRNGSAKYRPPQWDQKQPADQGRRGGRLNWLAYLPAVLLLLGIGFASPKAANSQVIPVPTAGQPQPLPKPLYYRLIGSHSFLHQGNFRTAENTFRNLYRGARKEGTQRWLDSAVYAVMRGEVCYQQGRYLDALAHYDEAADLFVFFTNKQPWTQRIDFRPQPPQFSQSAARRIQQLPWGKTGRRTRYGRFPTAYNHLFGRDQVIRGERGNTVIKGTYYQRTDVFEIFRSMALMIYRRDQILGPLSKVNSRSRILRNTLSDGLGISKAPVSVSLYRLLHGIAVAGEGKYEQSTEILNSVLQISDSGQRGSGRDHPLTSIALAQMGANSYNLGKFSDARNFYLEASYSAAAYEQYTVWMEAIIGAAKSHNAFEPQKPMPWLAAAAKWGRREGVRVAEGHFSLIGAENAIENSDIKAAEAALAVCNNSVRTTDLKKSAFWSRYSLIVSAVNLISGRTDDYTIFRRNLDLYRTTSLNQFRMKFINDPRTNRQLATAALEDLLSEINDDPGVDDWKRDPFECLSIITGDRTSRINQLILQTLKTRDFNGTLKHAEQIRRRVFLSYLPMGGRLSSIRDLIGKSTSQLDADQLKRQRELQGKFPALQDLMDESNKSEQLLRAHSLVPKPDEEKKWKEEVYKWAIANQKIERMFANFSMKREFVPIEFPEPPNLDVIQNRIPKETIALYIQQSGQIYHVFLITNEVVAYQNGVSVRLVNKELKKLVKEWSLTSYTTKLKATTLQKDNWRKSAREIAKLLVPQGTEDFWNDYKELVVIPDGQFWYLPFETLPLGDKPKSQLMIDKLAVRYAPMLSIGFSKPEPRRVDKFAYYPGKLYPKDDDALVESGRQAMERNLPSIETIERSEFLPHVLTSLADGVIYWPYFKEKQWPSNLVSPIKKKSELYKKISLANWNHWPNTGPKLMVVSGGVTTMAVGLKGKVVDGRELFLYSTLLMSGGCDSLVLSRWQTGGHTGYDFQGYLAKTLASSPEVMTADAVREASLEVRKSSIQYDKQARMTPSKKIPVLKATNPQFWAFPMVIDRGKWYPPEKEEEEDAQIPGLGGGSSAPDPSGQKTPPSGTKSVSNGNAEENGSDSKKMDDKTADDGKKDAKKDKSTSGDKKSKKDDEQNKKGKDN